MKSPILFLVFNRVDETIQSFETIRKAKPSRLYIAADGARSSVSGEAEVCNSVRNIVTNVDWDCEVFTLYREQNLGCKMAIVGAINWFFENEDEGIIIEDDVIPIPEFFPFCDVLLAKYRNNERIIAIDGFNQFGQNVVSNSYFFSRGFFPWGWATWKSRWKNYRERGLDVSRLDQDAIKKNYHKAAIDGVRFNINIINKGILDTWDYQVLFMMMVQNGYVVTPYANLTSNIGINGAHSLNNKNIFFKYGTLEHESILHPLTIEDDKVMNEKLWEEYREAHFTVKIKSLLLMLNLYLPVRLVYKKLKIFFISLSN